ncbi:MAG TPA: OmpH family outer membrane protein [Alphaproteobacteria bacterium]|jgi:outer membrane protein
MKKIPYKYQFVAVMFVIAAVFLGFQAQVRSSADKKEEAAASASTFKMAVVDVQALLTASEAAKNLEEQLKSRRETFQQEITDREKKLKEEEQALVAANGKGTEAEFNKKKAGFEKNVNDMRTMVAKRRRALEDGASQSLAQLRVEITKIVAEIAQKEKYNIVLTRQNVVLAENSMEITDAVMKELNAKVTKIDLKVEVN